MVAKRFDKASTGFLTCCLCLVAGLNWQARSSRLVVHATDMDNTKCLLRNFGNQKARLTHCFMGVGCRLEDCNGCSALAGVIPALFAKMTVKLSPYRQNKGIFSGVSAMTDDPIMFFFPLTVIVLLALIVPASLLIISWLAHPNRPNNPNKGQSVRVRIDGNRWYGFAAF